MVTRAGHDLSPVDEQERRAVGVGARTRRPFAIELLIFLGLGLSYLLLMPSIAWYPVYLTLGDTRWWMFVINSVAPYLFVPVPVVLLIALLARRWALLVTALIPAAVFLTIFGQLLVPRDLKVPAVPTDAPSLSLLTYNLHAWNTDVEGIVAALSAADVDVIALQELEPEMGQLLAERLGSKFPYTDLVPRRGWGGLGVFSTVPLTPVRERAGFAERNPQVTKLHLPWGDATLINVHNLSIPRTLPDWPTEITNSIRQREWVSDFIVEYAARDGAGPVIAAGDFNTTSRSTAYEVIASELTDSWVQAGLGFGATFPGGPFSPTPLGLEVPDWLLRIDYVFTSDEIVTTDARIGRWDGTSDHRPVRVTLTWPEAGSAD